MIEWQSRLDRPNDLILLLSLVTYLFFRNYHSYQPCTEPFVQAHISDLPAAHIQAKTIMHQCDFPVLYLCKQMSSMQPVFLLKFGYFYFCNLVGKHEVGELSVYFAALYTKAQVKFRAQWTGNYCHSTIPTVFIY